MMTVNGDGGKQKEEIEKLFKALEQQHEAVNFASHARTESLLAAAATRKFVEAKGTWWNFYGLLMLAGAFTLTAFGLRLLGIHF